MSLRVETERVVLRYPTIDDAPELFRLASDPEVTRHFSWGPYRELAEAERFLGTLPGRRRRGEALELLIVDRERGPVGLTGISELSVRDRRSVVGTWLGREHWGIGINAASKAAVLALAFDACGMERVTAWASTENLRSQRALERIGFVREGVLRAWHRHGGSPRDVVALSMLRREWLANPLRETPTEIRGRPPKAFDCKSRCSPR